MLTDTNDLAASVLEATVVHIRELLLDEDGAEQNITAVDTFSDLGLNSLLLAQLLIALESDFGVDPFSGGRSVADVHTVADLVEAYARAAQSEGTA